MTQNHSTQSFSPLPVLLSVHDAEKIGLTRSSFYRLMHRDDIPTVTIGGRMYIYRDKFIEWLNERAGGENIV